MRFEDSVKEANDRITKSYLELIVNNYAPLFERVKEKALKYLGEGSEFKLETSSDKLLIFSVSNKVGKFYDAQKNEVALEQLPRYYAERATNPHMAMMYALSDFVSKVKKHIADTFLLD